MVSSEEEEVFDFMLPVDDVSSLVSRLSFVLELRSKLPPGVLGVLLDEPKDAKAPEPSPKAFDAPAEGEDTPPERGDMALKGFERPCELSGPNRFDE